MADNSEFGQQFSYIEQQIGRLATYRDSHVAIIWASAGNIALDGPRQSRLQDGHERICTQIWALFQGYLVCHPANEKPVLW